jgi:hypothetical protein
MFGILMMANGHKLEVQLYSFFSATEIVRYDGEEKSRIWSWLGTTHSFEVPENGQPARYEVITRMTLTGAACTIKRNGELIFTHT